MAKFPNTRAGGTVTGYTGQGGAGIVKYELNIADILDDNPTAASGDEFAIVTAPADTNFELVQAEIVTTLDLDAGASDRVDIGDADDDDEFVTNATTLTAGTNLTITKATFTGGAVVPTAATMYLKLTGDKVTAGTATGIIRFVWRQENTARLAPMDTATL